MPPCYVNIGAYVDEGSMVDSLALVGSCAQVGKNVHIGGGCIIGGVLEPVGAIPVIIENNVFLGAGSQVTEGTIVKKGAIIGAGVTITSSTPIYDVVNNCIIKANENGQIVVPEGAVVVPGARKIKQEIDEIELSISTPIIVKYGSKVTLEDALRP
jgi:2,3,4,5-tetrahydropyridine-2-carboxylate N-succinyltransferase